MSKEVGGEKANKSLGNLYCFAYFSFCIVLPFCWSLQTFFRQNKLINCAFGTRNFQHFPKFASNSRNNFEALAQVVLKVFYFFGGISCTVIGLSAMHLKYKISSEQCEK